MPLIRNELSDMYQFSKKAQHPFGINLTVVDLYEMADLFFTDIVYILKEKKTGWLALISRCPASTRKL